MKKLLILTMLILPFSGLHAQETKSSVKQKKSVDPPKKDLPDAKDPAEADTFNGLPEPSKGCCPNETLNTEIIDLNGIRMLNKKHRAYSCIKPIRFGLINVNPYIYDVKINGYKVTYEYTSDIDSLIRTNLTTFPSIAAISRIQAFLGDSGITCAGTATITNLKKEYDAFEASFEQFVGDFDTHLSAYEELKTLTATYEEIRLACEMAGTKSDLVKEIKTSIDKFLPPAKRGKNYKDAIATLKDFYLDALKEFKPKALQYLGTAITLSTTASGLISRSNAALTHTATPAGDKACLDAIARNSSAGLEQLKIRKTILDTMNKVIFASAALEENIIKLHGLLRDIEQTTFSSVSAPVLFDSDEIDVEYLITPKAGLKYRITNLKNEQINVTYWRRWAAKAYVSVGIGFDNYNGKDYNVVGATGYDTTRFYNAAGMQDSMSIQKYDGYQIVEQNRSGGNLGLSLLTHLTWRVGYDARLGFNIGTQIDLNGKLKYLAGGTLTLGHDRLLNINIGACFGTTRDLKAGYSLAKVYKEDFESSKAPTFLSFDYMHPAFAASISYNLTFNRKRTAVPKPTSSTTATNAASPSTVTTTTTTTSK